MAVLLKFLIPFLLLLILSLEVYAGIVTCQAASTDGKETPSTCNGILHEPVCLLCSVRKSSKHISWTIESTTLAYEKHNLNASHAGGLTVNECDSDEYYSLRLQRPSVQYNNLRYKCRRDEEIVSEFILTLHVEAVLSINNSLISNGTFFLGFNESTQTLVCVITKAVPPFTLNWSINNVFKGTKVFNISSTTPTTCRYSMTFYDLETEDKLTCSSEGLFLQNDTITLTTIRGKVSIEDDSTLAAPKKEEHQRNNLNKNWILVVPIATLILCILAFAVVRRYSKQNSFNVENGLRDDVRDRNSEYRGSVNDTYSKIEYSAGKGHSETGHPSSETMSLLSKFKFNGIYEYWTGTYTKDGIKEEKCLVKSLSGQATLKEASEFQELARRTKKLRDSSSIVRLLRINVESNPYSIVYELMEYGTLRDFVMSRYQQSLTSMETTTRLVAQTRELVTFAINVANAMVFVHSQDFLHPVLSLKKILLTSQCSCKVYDICPSEMAKTKIESLRQKDHPPIAWMSPETIFLREFSPESDIWSFSTLLWELFSLGDTPYVGQDDKNIEQNIRRGVFLKQPPICPDPVYETMVLAWAKIIAARPSFKLIIENLESVLNSSGEDETSEAAEYFTLDTHQAHEYI